MLKAAFMKVSAKHIYIKNLIISVHLHKKYPTVDTTKTIYYYRYYWQIVEKVEIK